MEFVAKIIEDKLRAQQPVNDEIQNKFSWPSSSYSAGGGPGDGESLSRHMDRQKNLALRFFEEAASFEFVSPDSE